MGFNTKLDEQDQGIINCLLMINKLFGLTDGEKKELHRVRARVRRRTTQRAARASETPEERKRRKAEEREYYLANMDHLRAQSRARYYRKKRTAQEQKQRRAA